MTTLIASIILIGNVLTSATFCEGVRLDKTMSYHQFLQEYALDVGIQKELIESKSFQRLAQLKYEAYMKQAPNVKRGQIALCGKMSDNWND